MSPQIIRKAERLPNGRIVGAAPPVLAPRVLRMLSVQEQAKLYELEARRRAIQRESMKFLASLGLNPRGEYIFRKDGSVIERGNWQPLYG